MKRACFGIQEFFQFLKGSSVATSASVFQDGLVFHYIYKQLYIYSLLAMTHAPFHPKRGQCEKEKLPSLNDLVGYEVIINGSGLGAGKLINDENIRPARGQVVLVRALWIKHFVINNKRDKLTYVLPCTDSVVLGRSPQVGNWVEIVSPDIAELIMSRCVSLIPILCGAEAGLEGDRCEIL